jgi:hypothetical protein
LDDNTEEEDVALLVVKQRYKRAEYWSERVANSRNVRTEEDLLIVRSSIISVSVSVVLSS